MLASLRERLLVSYLGIIAMVLLMVTFALLGFATVSTVRYVPVLQRLAALSLTNQYELLQLRDAGTDARTIEEFLETTAVQQGVRILVAEARTRQVAYDTSDEDSWVGVIVTDVNQPQRVALDVTQGSIFGRFRHPNGTSWLVYAQPTGAFSRSLIFYAQPEPTPGAFFGEFFARPLIAAGALATVIAFVLAFGITQSVVRPLQRLAGAAEAIARGNYNQRVTPEGPTEVRRLAASFNSMAHQVKQTQQAQRDFLANVSHDLKTPLTAVSGWSHALLDGTAVSPEEQRQAATVIRDETDRMSRMVSQLLDLARIESGQLELVRQPLDLNAVLRDVAQTSTPAADEAAVVLQLDLAAIPPVSGDADRLTQVFGNLIDNAIIHSPPGCTIRVTSQTAVANGRPRQVQIQVQDNGSGIAPDELPRIFERFYQVDKSRQRTAGKQGYGLGLAIVRELVEAHGGSITAASKPGEGTTFSVLLPVEDTIQSRRSNG